MLKLKQIYSIFKPVSKTNASWSRFLDETPERLNVPGGKPIVELDRTFSAPPANAGTLDSLASVHSGIGADWAQRPMMAFR